MSIKTFKNFHEVLLMLLISTVLLVGCEPSLYNSVSNQNENISVEKHTYSDKADITSTKKDIDPNGYTNSKVKNTKTQAENTKKIQSALYNKLICIDPGHQTNANRTTEPNAPTSSIKKAKASSGTRGVVTKVPEYKFNLNVSLKLKDSLASHGAKVIMTRETHNIDISNAKRAILANEAKADIMIRIHADGSDNQKVSGISVLYPGDKFIHNKDVLESSKSAASYVYKELISSTKAIKRGTVKRNDITGFNWSKIPVILVECGFMSNPTEDRKLNTPEYQDILVDAMTKGLEAYFTN